LLDACYPAEPGNQFFESDSASGIWISKIKFFNLYSADWTVGAMFIQEQVSLIFEDREVSDSGLIVIPAPERPLATTRASKS